MVARPLSDSDGYSGYRQHLVDTLREKGVRDLAVLRAVSAVPRHQFVSEGVVHRAYEDAALPLAAGQTVSQPFVQARSLEALRLTGRERALEVGSGSGYQTALLAELVDTVIGVERIPALAEQARSRLQHLGYRNVSIVVGDGTLGWRSLAPFDAILVAAASPDIPGPLLEQLAPGGRMVIPIGDREEQILMLVERAGDRVTRTPLSDVRFVPLLGQFGFKGPE